MSILYAISCALATWLFMEASYDYIKLRRKPLTKTSMYKKVNLLLLASLTISIVYFFAELYWIVSGSYENVSATNELIWVIIECSLIIALGNACSICCGALIKIEYNLVYKVVDKYIELEAEQAAERHRLDDWLYSRSLTDYRSFNHL